MSLPGVRQLASCALALEKPWRMGYNRRAVTDGCCGAKERV